MIKTIGILGGGQLGRMMAIAARQMGYNIVVLDPTPNCPCSQVADKQIIAAFDDVEAAKELLNSCDVITYEFENVNLSVANALSAKLTQGADLLRITQNRIFEKEEINKAGLQTVTYRAITNENELALFIDDYKSDVRNVIIKTVQGGYDGKGQFVVKSIDELNFFLATDYNENIDYIAEDFFDFDKEVSIIVCRNAQGQIEIFPVAENIHKNQILHQSIVPARFSDTVKEKAKQIALKLAIHLNLIGTLAIEMFVKGDDVVINELAPRPHNSGHYTLNACFTNQFEQHIRSICNLPLGNVSLFSPVVMLNVLGQDKKLMEQKNLGENKLHLYGKTEAKANRKMGHINVVKGSVDECLNEVEKLLNFNNQ